MNPLPLLKKIPKEHLRGKRVLLRADFDVVVKNGRVLEDFRIDANLSTILYVLHAGGRIRIIAHLGRPRGKVVPRLGMRGVAAHFGRRLRKKVVFIRDPFSPQALKTHNDSKDILFFENIRFWPGEEKNSSLFAKKLSQWGDLYINECFATAHRNHASIAAVARLLPAFAGLHLEREIFYFNKIARHPRPPVVMILGGAKLKTKLPLIQRFLKQGSDVLIGGALANTLLAAHGVFVGESLVEKQYFGQFSARMLAHPRLHLPVDVCTAVKLNTTKKHMVRVDSIPADESAFDIGPKTTALFARIIQKAKTVFWNGPLGYAEIPQFSHGTRKIAQAISRARGFTVVGGGDTIAALRRYKLPEAFSHLSTGGGAMLKLLAGNKLPGIEALKYPKRVRPTMDKLLKR